MAYQENFVRPIEDRRGLGIGLIIVAVSLFAILEATAKYLVLDGIPPFEAAFVRHFGTLVIVVAIFAPRHGRAIYASKNIKLQVTRGLLMASGTVMNFVALQYLPLTISASIVFTMPLIVTALSGPLLGEQVGWRRWAAICVGFVGVLIIIRPGGVSFHPAVFFSLGTAVLYAVFNIINRKLAGVDSVVSQQYYAAVIGVLCLAPFAAMHWIWPQSGLGWFLFFIMGVVGTLAHLVATLAFRYASASTLAPFFYPQLIFVSVLSWLVFNQPPDIYMGLGGLIVIGAGLYVWMRERVKGAEITKAMPPPA